jgi:2,4-dienoyl-CoA reductase (NADPH2)
MEAARVAALRGHEVTLYEKSSQLGGRLPLAALIKGIELEDLREIVNYLKRQLEKLGVCTVLGQELGPGEILELAPEAVILATGGRLTVPELDGLYTPKVLTTPELHERVKPFLRVLGPRVLGRVTHHYLPVGKRVVVIGAGLHGCEVAEFLAKRGRSVTILEPSGTIGQGMLDFRLGLLLDWFPRVGVEIITEAQDLTIIPDGVSFSLPDGCRKVLQADTVIPTAPLAGDPSLERRLSGRLPEVFSVGDCRQPGMIVDAVADGWQVGRAL